VLSGFAIHHLPDERKRSLFGEIHDLLRAGGVFVNLEVVQCATPELHEEFNMALEPIDVSPPA
jgi:tRNA (cmo5U34)-methyltransferase